MNIKCGDIAITDSGTANIRFISKDCGFGICEAVKMMTAVPAELLGINKGKIDTGYDADLVVFDDDVNIEAIFVNGNKI